MSVIQNIIVDLKLQMLKYEEYLEMDPDPLTRKFLLGSYAALAFALNIINVHFNLGMKEEPYDPN